MRYLKTIDALRQIREHKTKVPEELLKADIFQEEESSTEKEEVKKEDSSRPKA